MTKGCTRSALALVVGWVMTAGPAATAADPPATIITIPDLDCLGCAKKVSAALAVVPGVGKTQPDVEAHIMRVNPKGAAALSPRALWEAVEKAGKTPARIDGPQGTFTSKPRS
jgi:copper chaperone CopZ